MAKFKKDSFEVISVTEIPSGCLLAGTLKLLDGRADFRDVDEEIDEKIYRGSIFETIACELAEMEGSPILPSQDVIDEINNLAEVVETELVRITEI